MLIPYIFFFQAEDGIRFRNVTGVQTCALPILFGASVYPSVSSAAFEAPAVKNPTVAAAPAVRPEIGRASCRERVWIRRGVGIVHESQGMVRIRRRWTSCDVVILIHTVTY